MNDNLIPIASTEFSEYFDNVSDCEIYLLPEDDAKLYWSNIFMDKSTSYFNLSNDNWFIKSKTYKIGEWINAYNATSNILLSDILTEEISWQNNDMVRFCVSSYCIFQTTWKCFKLYWSDFLAVDDDCPIVLSLVNTDTSILFTPIGDVFKVLKDI